MWAAAGFLLESQEKHMTTVDNIYDYRRIPADFTPGQEIKQDQDQNQVYIDK